MTEAELYNELVALTREKGRRRVLFEKVQHTGDCRLTGRFADDQNKPRQRIILECLPSGMQRALRDPCAPG